MGLWSPTGKARGNYIEYPPTPTCPPHKALAGGGFGGFYPPSAKSAEAAILEAMNNSDIVYAFIHG